MSEKSPLPEDPAVDARNDDDEPAFDWMKPPASGNKAAANTGGKDAGDKDEPAKDEPAGPAAAQPGSRADRKAAEAGGAGGSAAEPPLFAGVPGTEGTPDDGSSTAHPPTSALQIRPPEADVARRNAEREQAANAKPVAPRVFQVLLAVFYPVIMLMLAVRAVTSPLFLWVEYNRPGFPGDGYGFNTDDRITYGSYAIDYLSNWSGPRYLGELVGHDGEKLFLDSEVAHMADVKLVFLSSLGAGVLLILLGIIAMAYLRKRSRGGIRRGLFAGSVITLVLIIGLGVLGVLGWQQFFTAFHSIFFANGTWTFALEDTLIRLFPGQFWVDAGIVIAGLVFLAATVTFVLSWPTRRRRGLSSDSAVAEAREGAEALKD